jgi:hypothetical protein
MGASLGMVAGAILGERRPVACACRTARTAWEEESKTSRRGARLTQFGGSYRRKTAPLKPKGGAPSKRDTGSAANQERRVVPNGVAAGF